jgi:hypothetical protein
MFQIQPLEPMPRHAPVETPLSSRDTSVSRLAVLMGQLAAMPQGAGAVLDTKRQEPSLLIDPITWIEHPNKIYQIYQFVNGSKAIIYATADANAASQFLQHYFSAVSNERARLKSTTPAISALPGAMPGASITSAPNAMSTSTAQEMPHTANRLSGLIMQWLGAVSLGLLGVMALAWALGRVQFN